jgi:hypothetical protein
MPTTGHRGRGQRPRQPQWEPAQEGWAAGPVAAREQGAAPDDPLGKPGRSTGVRRELQGLDVVRRIIGGERQS